MDDFYSREITLADMPFLMHEFEEPPHPADTIFRSFAMS